MSDLAQVEDIVMRIINIRKELEGLADTVFNEYIADQITSICAEISNRETDLKNYLELYN